MHSYANLICSCYIGQYYVLCMYLYANPLICKTLYIKVYNKISFVKIGKSTTSRTKRQSRDKTQISYKSLYKIIL